MSEYISLACFLFAAFQLGRVWEIYCDAILAKAND